MVSSLLVGDTCVKKGEGMATSWTLSGLATAYDGTAKAVSDGYKIVASLTYVAVTSFTNNGQEALTGVCVMGTCVETLDSAGVRVTAATTTEGNNALCHWLYVLAGATSTPGSASTATGDWGETKYLTHAQWGSTSGAGVIGKTIKSNGTSIGSANGHALTPATAETVYAAGAKTYSWYQPTFAATYATTVLRRYNGGASDGDKVIAYCIKLRTQTLDTALTTGNVVKANSAGTSGVVTLTGATALVAGIAYGVSALAF